MTDLKFRQKWKSEVLCCAVESKTFNIIFTIKNVSISHDKAEGTLAKFMNKKGNFNFHLWTKRHNSHLCKKKKRKIRLEMLLQ